MIRGLGTPLVELDMRASELEKPFGVITVDCSNPHEYDDGIAVEVMPSAKELYRVSVFAADTSPFYGDESILRTVLEKTESVYRNERTPVETYAPMLPKDLVQRTHFIKNKTRSALIVSFLIGDNHPPDDVKIEFGRIEVAENYNYKRFGEKCRYSPNFEKYGRAAAYVLHHLHQEHQNPEEQYEEMIHVPATEAFRRGANMNQAFMVAAGYLVAKEVRKEDRLAIYRVHDPFDPSFEEIMSPKLARFSSIPSRHVGLGLEVYTRVTSPLRRAEDFIMHGLLRARSDGRELDKRDKRAVAATLQRLNQRIASACFDGRIRMRDEDLWTLSEDEVAKEQAAEAGSLGKYRSPIVD